MYGDYDSIIELLWLQGPKGETIGAMIQPLPYSYLIFRAPSEAAGSKVTLLRDV